MRSVIHRCSASLLGGLAAVLPLLGCSSTQENYVEPSWPNGTVTLSSPVSDTFFAPVEVFNEGDGFEMWISHNYADRPDLTAELAARLDIKGVPESGTYRCADASLSTVSITTSQGLDCEADCGSSSLGWWTLVITSTDLSADHRYYFVHGSLDAVLYYYSGERCGSLHAEF